MKRFTRICWAIKTDGRSVFFLALAVVCSWTALAQEAEPPPNAPLTLEAALDRVAKGNPRLSGNRFARDIARFRIDQAKLKPAWRVSAEAENFLGSGEASGFKGLETTLQLGSILERGGKLEARVDVAGRKRDLVEAELEALSVDVFGETAQRFIAVVEAQEKLQQSREALDLTRQVLATVQRRAERAKASPADLAKAEIEVAQAALIQARAQSEFEVARVSLASLWGARAASFDAVAADLFSLPAIQDFEKVLAAVENNPGLKRLASERRVREAQIRLAQTARLPDLEFNAGLRRMEDADDFALVASVSIPLGSPERSRPFEREAAARKSQLESGEAALKGEIARTVFAAYEGMRVARASYRDLTDNIGPKVDTMTRQLEEGYASGRYTLLDLLDAQRQRLKIRLQKIAAAAEYHYALLEIERLVGGRVAVSADPVKPTSKRD